MYTLQLLAPFIVGLCVDNFFTQKGELCNFRQLPNYVVKYDELNPKDSCYLDGIFYPRCKDLENPEVLHYHKLLYKNSGG